MRLEAQLFEFTARNGGRSDVINEGIYPCAPVKLSQVGEAEGARSVEDAFLIATGSGSGFATGPSQQLSIFALQSRQIVEPPTRKSEILCG